MNVTRTGECPNGDQALQSWCSLDEDCPDGYYCPQHLGACCKGARQKKGSPASPSRAFSLGPPLLLWLL